MGVLLVKAKLLRMLRRGGCASKDFASSITFDDAGLNIKGGEGGPMMQPPSLLYLSGSDGLWFSLPAP
jgi:hypothetical protein